VLDEFCSVPTVREVGDPERPDDGVVLHVSLDAQPAAAHPELGLELQEGRA